MKTMTYLIIIFMVISPNRAFSDNTVYFADPNLKTSVEEELGISDPNITEILELTKLEANNKGIVYINGIEYATKLNELNLNNNKISDLSSLSGLVNLKELNLRCNRIYDIGPISHLTNLDWLDARNNFIVDVSSLSEMTSLWDLFLAYNQINDISMLSGLTELSWLDLACNKISDISALSGLINLQGLCLEYNNVNDISALSGLIYLDCLFLSDNRIGDISPLSDLTRLFYLALAGNQISDISALSGLAGLFFLDLERNNIVDIHPLSQYWGLDTLLLSGNKISDVTSLPKCVFQLSLADNQISDASVFLGFPNLLDLDLRSNPLSNDSLDILNEDDGLWFVIFDSGVYRLWLLSTGCGFTKPGEGYYTYSYATYPHPGRLVQIEAVAECNYRFANWSGTAVDAGKVADPYSASTTVIVDSDYILKANFTPTENPLAEPLCTWMVGKVPYYHQYVNNGAQTEWCAQVCLKMLFHWWEDYQSLSDINTYFDIFAPYSQEDYMTTQWFTDVISAVEQAGYNIDYGWRSIGEQVPINTLKNHIIRGNPVIVVLGKYEDNEMDLPMPKRHFAVVVGFDEILDVFYLHDPDDFLTGNIQNDSEGFDAAISSASFLDYWDRIFYPGTPHPPAYCGWIAVYMNNATHSRTSFHTVNDARNEKDINNAPDIINAPDVVFF